MSPRIDAALRALQPEPKEDLRSLRVAALGFKVAVRGARPIAVAVAVDDEGVEHWVGVRSATRGVELAYHQLLTDLLARGLRAAGPLLVDADGYPRLARRLDRALGPVVHAGVARELKGCGLAW